METSDLRVQKLRTLIRTRFNGLQRNLAEAIERQPDYISRCLSGKKRVGEDLARDIERLLKLPPFWLDRPPSPDDDDIAAGRLQIITSVINAHPPAEVGMTITSIPAIATPPPGSRVDMWETLADLPHGGAYVQVPHYDVAVSAGDGCQWVDHANNDPLVFRARWFQARGVKPEDCRAIYVRGDSMAPTLNDGDTVLIDVSRTQVRDDSIYALVYGGDLYIKRLFRIPGGGLELRSDNPRHLNREVTGGAMADVHVLGEMIWRAG
jgi:hypothetical protein